MPKPINNSLNLSELRINSHPPSVNFKDLRAKKIIFAELADSLVGPKALRRISIFSKVLEIFKKLTLRMVTLFSI